MSDSLALEVDAEFPPKLQFLFRPKRYKVAYGGRGGAKSWGVARALLIQGLKKPLRILCAREVQKSIKDSVHQLLCDQIEALKLGAFYRILNDEIRGLNGTLFIFSGLADKTTESIKSFEGIDIVWCEEARAITKRSWSILIPTIRKPDSEIWVTFNPELDTDETYKRFVLNPPANSEVVKIGWQDNQWFPRVLEEERLTLQAQDPDEYANVWEGEPRAAVAGAIYAKEITEAQQEGRFRVLPYDPMLKVHVVSDLGFNDAMATALVQRSLSEVRVIDYLEDSHKTLDWYSAELKKKNYNWGKWYLPHDAEHKTLASEGRSVQQMIQNLGWGTEIVPNVQVEVGIKLARMVLKRTYMDAAKCERLIECLKRYRRIISSTTNEPGNPVHDEYSHGADAFRYLAIVADKMTNSEATNWGALKYDHRGIR